MAARRGRPWRMVAPVATVVVIALLWSAYWVAASTTIKSAYADGVRRLSAKGIAIACDDIRWGGFPFRVEQNCRAPKVSIDGAGKAVVISAASALLAVQIYDPRHAVALLDGPTVIAGPTPSEITHGRALASLRLSSDESWQASIELPTVAVNPLGKADRITAHARETGDGNLDLAVTAENLELRLADGSKLSLSSFALTAALPKEALDHEVPRYLATSGKQVLISSISAARGELEVTGSGAFGVDAQGYLNGRVSTRVTRMDLLLEIMAPIAKLSDDDVKAAKTVLSLLQKGGGTSGSQLDVIAKDHKLYVGPFKIADLKPLF